MNGNQKKMSLKTSENSLSRKCRGKTQEKWSKKMSQETLRMKEGMRSWAGIK